MTLLRRQPPMRRVLLATLPCVAGSVYYFGWRSLAVILVSCLAAFLAEFVFCRRRKEPVSEAVFVTGILYGLVMPPAVPWHVLIVGIVFAIVFVKEAFGGFGRNVFNPAVAGRCFVYVCFPAAMTAQWTPVAQGPLGALAQWTPAGVDTVTSATPMALMKAGKFIPSAADLFHGMFLGRIDGTLGVTSAMLILIGGAYLLFSRTANRTLVITVILAYAALTQGLHWLGVEPVPNALPALLGGGFLFGVFFMVTEPVSAPSTRGGRVAYAVLIAVCTVVIRNFSIFNGGLMFAILIGNMFAPILDHAAKEWRKPVKAES
ncbi:MAG: RnfABCDGE type electron transport complex subunit D [Lentisphaerales bacterium]|nr:MAG: RnfABCDGE type electron transport complex subunit D [Lentisphaerales bacterium]